MSLQQGRTKTDSRGETTARRSVEALAGSAKLVLGAVERLVLEHLLPELGLDPAEEEDERAERLLDGDDGRLGAVRLDLEHDARLERVRHLVAGKDDRRQEKQLAADEWARCQARVCAGLGAQERGRGTHERNMLASVWSSLLIVSVAAFGILVSSSTVTL